MESIEMQLDDLFQRIRYVYDYNYIIWILDASPGKFVPYILAGHMTP